MRLYHASTICIEKPDVLHSRDKLDFGRGFLTKDEALGRLKYEKPNHQLCILNGNMLDSHLHFIYPSSIIPPPMNS